MWYPSPTHTRCHGPCSFTWAGLLLGCPYQLEELVPLLWMEVQAGEGQQDAAQVGCGDIWGSEQEVLGRSRAAEGQGKFQIVSLPFATQ